MASLSWSLLMLLLVVGAIPACLWAMKRLQQLQPGGASQRHMTVLSQLSLGPRERLVTVRVGERVLVLGVTAQQVALVTELPEGLPPAPPAPAPAARPPFPFSGRLK